MEGVTKLGSFTEVGTGSAAGKSSCEGLCLGYGGKDTGHEAGVRGLDGEEEENSPSDVVGGSTSCISVEGPGTDTMP